jgi:hypothetical protein
MITRAASTVEMPSSRAICSSFCHRGVADAALGGVDDALEGQVVVRRLDQPQIGVGVADFGPFEEPRAADHLVGDLQHHEALFEGPHLERGADQDGHLAVLAAGPLGLLDLVGDHPALGLAVPDAATLTFSPPARSRSTASCPAGSCWR